MNYSIHFEKRILKNFKKIPVKDQDSILQVIMNLAENPRPNGTKKLSGREGWRIRIGNYRAIYEINDKSMEILIVDINHRKDIYRG